MGSAASTIPAQIDLNTFRRLSGCGSGTSGSASQQHIDALFDTYSTNGHISKDKLIEIVQATDCFFSHEWNLDLHGRNNHQRVRTIHDALKQKGLLIGFDVNAFLGKNVALHLQHGIEKTRSVAIFVTKAYIDKVNANLKSESCVVELTSIIQKKGLNQCVLVLMDTAATNRASWGQTFSLFAKHTIVVDMSTNDRLDEKIEQLHKHILGISRPDSVLPSIENGEVGPQTTMTPAPTHSSSMASFVDPAVLTREDIQFAEWLQRSTKISESKRVIYCSVLVKAGVHTIKDLALKMQSKEGFLLKLGFDGVDAESVALAIKDMGLGNSSIRDFNHGSSVEMVQFAINKAVSVPLDHDLSANAFSCVSRVASINMSMSNILCEAGVAAATVKLLQQHISSENAVGEALNAIKCLAVGEAAINVLMNSGACNVITQCMASHPTSAHIQAAGAMSIARVGSNPDARAKFGQAGACECIIRALSKHCENPDVVEPVCLALNELSSNVDNNAKFGNFGAPAALCLALTANQTCARVLRVGFKTLQITATIVENRITLGDNGIAMCVVMGLKGCGAGDMTVCLEGCSAIASLVVGSAINRTRLSKAGACEAVLALFQRYMAQVAEADQTNQALSEDITAVIRSLCVAMYALGSGNSDNQKKMYCIKPLLASVVKDSRVSDATRMAAKEADTCIQVGR